MRITYRKKSVDEYWKDRWDSINADDEMTAINDYPLKYALKTIKNKSGKILEAGCGTGRIVRYFHNRDYDIEGFDYIDSAIKKLHKKDKTLKVSQNNILKTNISNEYYDYILAFGLYHNFNLDDIASALDETYRILKKDGKLCLSFRADNLQNYLNDYLKTNKSLEIKKFHKINLKNKELHNILEKNSFANEKFYYVQNMPLIYKFSFFRHTSQKKFDESMARKKGYRLNILGTFLQKILMYFAGSIFCNVYVVICKK